MKVLVIRDQHRLMSDFHQLVEHRVEEIHAIPIDWRAIGDSIDLQEVIDRQAPDYILMLPILAPERLDEDQSRFRALMRSLTTLLAQSEIPLLFLSSAAVFPGRQLNYRESDACEPTNAMGQVYLDAENLINSSLERFIILRSGWMFSHDSENFLTSVIEYAASNTKISVNSAGKGCPTAMRDIARVLLAMLLQLDLDVDVWGTYHYSSSDAAIGFQFIETILAQAAQFNGDIDPKQLLFEHSDLPTGDFYFEPVVLECSKLKDTFGVHQKPWRAMLSGVVKNYFNEVPS